MSDHSSEPAADSKPVASSRHLAILSAALELVAEVGYERVTMDAIASRCRASKATMYRRWDCKASLIADALKDHPQWSPVLGDGGSLRSDLIRGLQSMAANRCNVDYDVYGGLLTAGRRDGELANFLREAIVANELAFAELIVTRASARGEPLVNNSAELICEVAPPILLTRLLLTGKPVDENYITHLVDDILLPLVDRSSCSSDL